MTYPKSPYNCLICNCVYLSYRFKRYCSFECWQKRKFDGKGTVIINCDFCGQKVLKHKSALQQKGKYCNIKCYGNHQKILKKATDLIDVECVHCSKIFKRRKRFTFKIFTKDVSKNNFCSRKCSDLFHHKYAKVPAGESVVIIKTGYSKSIIEQYLAEKIKLNFPFLKMERNDKKMIGYDLDIYFPELGTAIEVNGAWHYKPLRGVERLKQIQANDARKQILCKERKINLIIAKLDENFNHVRGEFVWSLLKKEIVKLFPFCEPQTEPILYFNIKRYRKENPKKFKTFEINSN